MPAALLPDKQKQYHLIRETRMADSPYIASP